MQVKSRGGFKYACALVYPRCYEWRGSTLRPVRYYCYYYYYYYYYYYACVLFTHFSHDASARSGPGFTIKLRHTTLGRTPLGEWSARRRNLYVTTHNNHNRQTSIPRRDSKPQSQKASGLRPTPLTARPLGSALFTIYNICYTIFILLITYILCPHLMFSHLLILLYWNKYKDFNPV
jgi:hypothetical protein